MNRWNGWGAETFEYPLPESAVNFLEKKIGKATPYPDAKLIDVIEKVPDSQLKETALIKTGPDVRLRHALGQSLPDWVAVRSGDIPAFPDGVAFPTSIYDVQTVLAYAQNNGAKVIPYGGGTSVVGHINPQPGDSPVLTVDMRGLSKLENLDEISQLATFGAGVTGPDLEKLLNQTGYTLGHFPQSFEHSTLGGWIATRSRGQQSYFYGGIETLFAGGHMETPIGPLELHAHPASAAGPDLRHLILGSEGRLGIITHAQVHIRPKPEIERFFGVFFKTWNDGLKAVHTAAQTGLPISMMRLSGAQETQANLVLAGKKRLTGWADMALNTMKFREFRCLMIVGVTGNKETVRQTRRQANSLFRKYGGMPVGAFPGNLWRKSRFLTPYLRNSLWERGIAIDTLETAVPWQKIPAIAQALRAGIENGMESLSERVLVLTHLSHVYRDGASVYITLLFRRTADPRDLLIRWQVMKTAASQIIMNHGGTISHQHGVGIDHEPYMYEEKGALGVKVIRQVSRTLDPNGLMNPGKLIGASLSAGEPTLHLRGM